MNLKQLLIKCVDGKKTSVNLINYKERTVRHRARLIQIAYLKQPRVERLYLKKGVFMT